MGNRCAGQGRHPCASGWLRKHLVPTVMVVALVTGCGSEPIPGSTPSSAEAMPVAAWTVDTATITERRRWSGRLEPLRVIAVQAPETGRIEFTDIRDGQQVTRGDVLVRMAGPQILARQAVLVERRERLDDQLQRLERLAQTGDVGESDLTEARLRVLEVEEAIAAGEASLESYVVRAPVSGIVTGTSVDSASHVSAGQQLMRIEDADSFGLRLRLPARETKYIDDSSGVRVVDDRGEAFEIDRIVYADNGVAGFVTADIYLSGVRDFRRREIEVIYQSTEDVLIVPWTAVASDDGVTWVAFIDGDTARIERREVTLGRGQPTGIEVTGGLERGDIVVRFEPRSQPEGRLVEPVGL